VNLYIGNLSFNTSEDAVRQAFAAHGTVTSVRIITDRDTGQSRGFGFVEMEDSQAAQTAMNALNGQDLDGRALTINEARPREPRRDAPQRSRW
jgi:RNA recognition motif-containing protein